MWYGSLASQAVDAAFFRLELSISDGMSGHAIAKLGLVVARVSEWLVNNPSRCTGGGGQHAK